MWLCCGLIDVEISIFVIRNESTCLLLSGIEILLITISSNPNLFFFSLFRGDSPFFLLFFFDAKWKLFQETTATAALDSTRPATLRLFFREQTNPSRGEKLGLGVGTSGLFHPMGN